MKLEEKLIRKIQAWKIWDVKWVITEKSCKTPGGFTVSKSQALRDRRYRLDRLVREMIEDVKNHVPGR